MEAIYTFDYAILNWMQNTLRCNFLDVLMRCITYLSEYGIFWILIAVVMLFFKKTRKIGLSIGVAMVLGLIFGNAILKNVVARERPYSELGDFSYMKMTVELLIKTPWDYSFPSGHALSAFSAATVLTIWDKRYGIPAIILAVLIGISRVYLYVHYPTDVLASVVLGIICGILGYFIVKLIWEKTTKLIDAKKQNKAG